MLECPSAIVIMFTSFWGHSLPRIKNSRQLAKFEMAVIGLQEEGLLSVSTLLVGGREGKNSCN